MKIIALFNNKGGVGKSTLAYHVGHSLSELGHKTLLIDLDPQCNLTICGLGEEDLHNIWEEEDPYIDDFEESEKKLKNLKTLLSRPRSIHFLLKPTEDGISDTDLYPPVVKIAKNLDLIPGRLSIHKYENKLAERWSAAYQGDNLSIRTITKIRSICIDYAEQNKYKYIIIDTSPSLGILNKTIISTVDGFVIPAQPDMFSLYGIRNIGSALESWHKEFKTMFGLISDEKRAKFPKNFVQFLGYTIYNARPYAGLNEYDLSHAHYNYVKQIPDTIIAFIKQSNRESIEEKTLKKPIGGKSVMHSHNTFPSISQKYKVPIWLIPEKASEVEEDSKQRNSIAGNKKIYQALRAKYKTFTKDFLTRVTSL